MNSNLIRRQAADLLKRLEIADGPVPVDRVAKMLGVALKYSPLDEELSGMAFIYNGRPVVGINSLHHPNRQRFTLAHEIGHIVLHPDAVSTEVHVDKQFRISLAMTQGHHLRVDMDAEAIQFAMELLIPWDLALKELELACDIDDRSFMDDMAKRFKVSVPVVGHRIRHLNATCRAN